MGGKMRTILLLCVVLYAIYCQQSAIIHAEDAAREYLEESAEEAGGAAGTESDESGPGEPGSGEEPGPDSGEEPDGGETSEGEPEKEPEPLRPYELEYGEPDGDNGYYVSVPEVRLTHTDSRGATVYSLSCGEELKASGRLEEEGASVLLSGEQFAEGRNVLDVYMEDEEGIRMEECGRTLEFFLDTKPPEVTLGAPEGFDKWYRKEVWISVSSSDGDAGSQIGSVSCYCGDELVGTAKGPEARFLIDRACSGESGVDVTVAVSDRAGHRRESTRKLYIDQTAPRILLEGITDYMITGEPVEVSCKIIEDNGFSDFHAEAEWTGPDGTVQVLPPGDWAQEGGIRASSMRFDEDGIYRIKVSAADKAGYTAEREAQIILDSHDPTIRFLDRLDGQYVRSFRWDYPKEEFIEDFTTYDYQMQLDGRLYSAGAEVEEEGRHVLRVEAVDSAGNRAEARAGFVIDRTPPEIIFSDVEKEKKYEEKKTFKVALENAEDEIREIRINGTPKPVVQGRRVYQYTVQEPGIYEVSVTAGDRAGNRAASEIMFEVVPAETVLQKILKPVRKVLRTEENSRKEKTGEPVRKTKEEPADGYAGLLLLALAGAAVCAAAAVLAFLITGKHRRD